MNNEARIMYRCLIAAGVPARFLPVDLAPYAKAAIYYGWHFADIFGSATDAVNFYISRLSRRLGGIACL